ncbi:MAG: hypothetical protein JRJ37_06635 [Deltaproteobacteria bacterium]|nr:hypothetical protein [Deltaproteobacteria bacterium]
MAIRIQAVTKESRMDLHGAGQSVAKSSSIAAISRLSFDSSHYKSNGRAILPAKPQISFICYKIKRVDTGITVNLLYSFKLIFCRNAKKEKGL